MSFQRHRAGCRRNQWPPEPAHRTLYALEEPQYRIRAAHSESTITVYQAYSADIGLPAARDGRFPAVWKRDRMTWVINRVHRP
ncbi:DUF4291 family protein [Streptomyces panaciradicis]|uniref:DUF4291 family protein n=1 Tax=Streptomyces panaciradicis TaxID=1470261 RepID=UPI00201CEC9A|nr:DUF4291 family protein [Streptomyces panaciradicis]MCL6666920.1 DUF4291 domain-containing protein [Streptomyces panaciradicis]